MSRFVSMVAALVVMASTVGNAAEQWQTSTIKHVYPQADGNFVVVLDIDPPQCTAAGPGKYLYVYVGYNAMTLEGRKNLMAVFLAALHSRAAVSVAYDDALPQCYINRAAGLAP